MIRQIDNLITHLFLVMILLLFNRESFVIQLSTN